MSNTIKLSEVEFASEINIWKSNVADIDLSEEDLTLDVSDTMTLNKLSMTFQDMTDLMKNYKLLLQKDIVSVRKIAGVYSEMDAKIVQIFNGITTK